VQGDQWRGCAPPPPHNARVCPINFIIIFAVRLHSFPFRCPCRCTATGNLVRLHFVNFVTRQCVCQRRGDELQLAARTDASTWEGDVLASTAAAVRGPFDIAPKGQLSVVEMRHTCVEIFKFPQHARRAQHNWAMEDFLRPSGDAGPRYREHEMASPMAQPPLVGQLRVGGDGDTAPKAAFVVSRSSASDTAQFL
jgi:hypothetical protein